MGYKWNWTEDMDFPNFNTIHLNYPTKGLMTYSNRSLDTIRKQHSSGDIRMAKSDEFLSESDFDWVNNVDSMKLYSVQQLEDGKYYVFHPKKDVVDPQRPGSPPPDWVHDYEGQTIQVIHNDRIGRRIEFIPHGKITRMRWKEKTTSVTLDHMAQMFVYGEFSEVQGINESDDFGWTGDVESSEILVNDKFRIPTINPDGSNYSIIQVNKIVIETYFERTKNGVLKPNRVRKISFSRHSGMGELQVRNEVMNEDDFLKYITREGMVPFYTNKGYKNINESSEFDWIDEIPEYHLVLNKAFYFNPTAERGDGTYRKLVQYFKSLGYKPKYSTPDYPQAGGVFGLYTYRDVDGELSYVYTHDDDGDFKTHITSFAEDDSEDGGKNLEVVDAREFVKNI
jgi:hypothetical protein